MYMVHVCTAYVYVTTGAWYIYNIFTYVYVPTGTWYMLVHCKTSKLTYVHLPTGTWYMPVQHPHICTCTNRYMVHAWTTSTHIHVPTGTWYMPVQHLHICTCTNRCMVHACKTYTHMYMYQQVHGTCLYNIYTYVYVPWFCT